MLFCFCFDIITVAFSFNVNVALLYCFAFLGSDGTSLLPDAPALLSLAVKPTSDQFLIDKYQTPNDLVSSTTNWALVS